MDRPTPTTNKHFAKDVYFDASYEKYLKIKLYRFSLHMTDNFLIYIIYVDYQDKILWSPTYAWLSYRVTFGKN